MAIKYPILILIFIVLYIIVFFIKGKRKEKKNNIKIANTSIVKRTGYYKNILARYRLLLYLLYGVLFLGLIGTSFLSSRVYKKTIISDEIYNRDIMLCLDVSASTNKLNQQLVEKYQELVDELKGERVGISVFNCTSYLLVPLTEDYEYIEYALDRMEKGFDCGNSILCYNDDYRYVINGTIMDTSRGSSLIGDGLASCVYAFPNLEEKRARSIILVTDNEVYGKELISVVDAAKIAKKKNITIYTISPKSSLKKNISLLQEVSKITGGKSYSETDDINAIVNEINKKEKTLLEGKKQEVEYDHPTIPFVVLMLSFAVILFIDKELIR